MKIVVQTQQVQFINDFTDHVMDIVPVTLTMEFGYGSNRDGDTIEMHFDDYHGQLILNFIETLKHKAKHDIN